MTGLPDFGLFRPEDIASALNKEIEILAREDFRAYLDTRIPDSYAVSAARKPPPKPRGKQHDSHDYRVRLRAWERAKKQVDDFDREQFQRTRCELALALMASMTDVELLYGYLHAESAPLSQAYSLALENRKLMTQPIGRILGREYLEN